MDNTKSPTLGQIEREVEKNNATDENSKEISSKVVVDEGTFIKILLKSLYAIIYILVFTALNLKYKCVYTF